MKTKTNKTNNGRSFARIALAATTVLALAGRAHANPIPCTTDGEYVSTIGQACTACPTGTKSDGTQDGTQAGFCSMVAAGYYGDAGAPGVSHAVAVGKTLGSCAANSLTSCPTICPTGSSTSAASSLNVAVAACTLDAGYYISTKASSATDATGIVISAAPKNYYVLTGSTISATSQTSTHVWDGTTASAAAAAGVIACPTNTVTAATRSTTLALCLVKPGYYISTKASSATDATDLVLTAVPAGHYSDGIIPISASSTAVWDGTTLGATKAAAGVIACPPNSNTLAGVTGSDSLGSCVTDAGWYVSVHSTSSPTLAQAPVTHYAKGGVSVTNALNIPTTVGTNDFPANQLYACPTGFATSAVGKSARTDCKMTVASGSPSGTDAFLVATAPSSASGVEVSACPEGTSSTAFTVAANGGSNTANHCTVTKTGYYGTQGNGDHATAIRCPFAGTSPVASTAITSCSSTACGTSIHTEVHSNTCRCVAGAYGSPTDASGLAVFTATGGCTLCTATFTSASAITSAAGSTSVLGCVTSPGYFISTARGTNAESSVVVTSVAANKYAPGGEVLFSAERNTGVIACPFAGTTSSAGRSLLTECVPDCLSTTPDSNAEDASGTCRCKANYYGTPKDTNGATVLAVTTKCTACDAGKTAVAGSTAASACTGAAPATADADTAASGAAGMSVLAAISAMAAAQLVL